MNSPFMWFIFFWVFVMVGLFAIGGYFMFRKFLKSLPMGMWMTTETTPLSEHPSDPANSQV